jgi:hypothetical protein
VIVEIEAKFSCDDCGTEFMVTLDPAYEPPSGWSIHAVAEDAIRQGLSYRDAQDVHFGLGLVGDDGRHYCDGCRKPRDESDV